MPLFLIWISVITSLIALGVGFYFLWRFLRLRGLIDLLQLNLFLIKIPKEYQTEGKDFKIEINRSEQLFSALSALKKPVVFEVAVPHVGEEIHFYLAAPKSLSETVIKQIQGIWAGAGIEPIADDYNIFNSEGTSMAAYLAQKENFALPIRTYQEIGSDTFAPILGGFSRVNEIGEGAALQIILQPAKSGLKKEVLNYITRMKRGESSKRVFGHHFISFADIQEALSPEKKEEVIQITQARTPIVEEDVVKALDAKIAKPLFYANVRILASAATPLQADTILDGLTAGFSQFNAPQRNELKLVKPRNPKKTIYQFVFRKFDPSQTMTLNSEEIASFFHLPIFSTETPKLKWLKAKEAPPPANLPNDGVLIGESVFRGQAKPIHITDDDRRRHIYLVGQTGTGKSTLLANMVIDDIKKGKGAAIIDPHGDLIENILGLIPQDRFDDLIVFNPGDIARPVGLNMLDYNLDRPEEKTFIVNEMQGIFNKLFLPETMGPMFEQYMRNALLLLMEDFQNDPATLIDVPRIFTDSDYRESKLERIRNPVILEFWEKEAPRVGGEASLANMTPYITSKFNNFIANDFVRPIIGQTKSAFNFRRLMDEGKILLVNLAKGRIGDINAGLLGMIITGKIMMAAMSRTEILEEKQRRDFYLYIDEFQNFTTDSIASMLAEARKYRLNLIMAHQFIAQLTEKIRDAVFGNVGSMTVFRIGAQDAEFLVKQFEPIFNQNDLLNIDNFNAYVKILINGETSKAFNIRTFPPERGNRELSEKLKEYSRRKYGAEQQAVETEIYRRLRE